MAPRMRSSHRLAVPAALAVLATVLLTGCGAGGGLSNVPAPPAPGQVVDTALARLGTSPIHFTITDSVGFDTSEIRGGSTELGFGGADDTLTIKGEGVQENQKRISMSLSAVSPATNAKQIGLSAVEYDGSTFVSADGGRFRQVDTTAALFGGTGLGPGDMPGAAGDVETLGSVSAQGYAAGTTAGQQRYHVELGDTFAHTFVAAYARAVSSSTAALEPAKAAAESSWPAIVEQASYYKQGSLDVDIDPATGRVAHLSLTLAVSLSFDRINELGGLPCGCRLPSGTLITTETVDLVVTPAGAQTTVSRPSPDPKAPVPGSRGVSGFSI